MTPDRRNQLILALLGSVAVAAVVYTAVISPLNVKLGATRRDLVALDERLNKNRNQQAQIVADAAGLAQLDSLLASWEGLLPSGDPYAFLTRRLPDLAKPYGIEELAIDRPRSKPEAVAQMSKAVNYLGFSATLRGVANYEQIGGFIAELENGLPFAQVTQLQLMRTTEAPRADGSTRASIGFSLVLEGAALPTAALQ